MSINLKDLEALKKVIKESPALREKLQSTPGVTERTALLSEIATSYNIPFTAADHVQFLESTVKSTYTEPLTESELELVAAGNVSEFNEKAILKFLYGTGLGGAVVSIAAEIAEPGGAKKLADYTFHDGPRIG